MTYGPFPGGWPAELDRDFRKIAASGFNSVRLFEMPGPQLLDAAHRHGLKVFGGLKWGQHVDFLRDPSVLAQARVSLAMSLRETGGHPAMAGVYVGNEIPADLVRWMGPLKVRLAIEDLISLGRSISPSLGFAYANYPSTEYLEPENADFSAFNVYLEDREALRGYLKRLQHIAGDRPLLISEFGLDSLRNGLVRQAEILKWAVEICRVEETAGMTIYAWSDRWWNAGAEVQDWDFGLVDRQGREKPALAAVSDCLNHMESLAGGADPGFSVIVCTRNGRNRIGGCLRALAEQIMPPGQTFETIVVDDGSNDGTADLVARDFPEVTLMRLDPRGLSAARNAGARAANGSVLVYTDDDCEPDREWLMRLARVFADGRFDVAGGPNLAPPARTWQEAVVQAAPGSPSHVMLDDEEAEHLPGCNLAVTREAFDAVGGFDERFWTAGDDVDFCWRLRNAGFRLGFSPGAFVWHWRRPGIRSFLQQQVGYGRAERLLMKIHPQRFDSAGRTRWDGFIYGGGPVRVLEGSLIYHGPMGTAGYQSICNRMLPLRGLDSRFDHGFTRATLRLVTALVPWVRAWYRAGSIPGFRDVFPMKQPAPPRPPDAEWTVTGMAREEVLAQMIADGCTPGAATDPWDLEKSGTRYLLATERGDLGSVRTLVRSWSAGAVEARR